MPEAAARTPAFASLFFFVDKKSRISYHFRQKWDNFYVTMEQKMKAGERMEQTERRGTKEEWKLPKNVRQIGEPGAGSGRKILIEDYVYTYLHQMAESNLTCMKTAVLVGRIEREAAIIYRALWKQIWDRSRENGSPMNTGVRFSGRFGPGSRGRKWLAGIWRIRDFRRY